MTAAAKAIRSLWAVAPAAAAALVNFCGAAYAQGPACTGAFPNLITDVCWDCVFPVSMGGGLVNMGISGDDYDTGAGKSPVCICAKDFSVGTPVGFWEPRYMVDTTNVPGLPSASRWDHDHSALQRERDRRLRPERRAHPRHESHRVHARQRIPEPDHRVRSAW